MADKIDSEDLRALKDLTSPTLENKMFPSRTRVRCSPRTFDYIPTSEEGFREGLRRNVDDEFTVGDISEATVTGIVSDINRYQRLTHFGLVQQHVRTVKRPDNPMLVTFEITDQGVRRLGFSEIVHEHGKL